MSTQPETWEHDKLAEDLAAALDTCWLQVPLGSVLLERAQLADVITIKPSYTRFCLHIYEVKVSRGDLRKDLRLEKWRGYLPHCHRLYFAVPAGLAKKDEIPAEAGLIVRGAKGWRVQKAAPNRRIDIPTNTLYSMLFMKNRLTVRQRNVNAALGISRAYYDWSEKQRQARYLGKRIAKALTDQEETEHIKNTYQKRLDQFQSLVKEGLGHEVEDDNWVMWDVKKLVEQIKQKAEATS